MKTKILGFIVLILITVFAFSCHKFKHYELTEVDYQMIPYKLGQTISFIDSLGQTFTLKVTKDATSLEVIDYDYVSIDRWSVNLEPEFGNFWITLFIEGNWKSYYNRIFITTSIFNNYTFSLSYDNEGQFVADSISGLYKKYYYDSLEINDKVYYDVGEYIICKRVSSPDKNESHLPVRLLYNKTYGILQLADKDKVLLTIDN
jgi:hypothetical protein